MKKHNFKIRQIKNIRTGDLYVTSAEWPSKEIDGITFITVKKTADAQQSDLIRKDGMEFVK